MVCFAKGTDLLQNVQGIFDNDENFTAEIAVRIHMVSTKPFRLITKFDDKCVYYCQKIS